MSIREAPQSTWEKRFFQSHYHYRDATSVTTGATPSAYVFGTAARLVSIYNWPQAGDLPKIPTPPLTCYAREVTVICTQDAYIQFICTNPRYLEMLVQGYTVPQLAALGVPITITDPPIPIRGTNAYTFNLTYGISLLYYQSTVSGRLDIIAEGNVEGGE